MTGAPRALSRRRVIALAVLSPLVIWGVLELLALGALAVLPAPATRTDLVATGDDWLPNVKRALKDSFFVRDRNALWLQRPGYRRAPDPDGMWGDEELAINELGHRGAAIPEQKPEGMRRVLVLGGSQPFGMGVGTSETYAESLQRLLNLREAGRWQVLNGAVPGHSTFQMRQYLTHQGLALAPDIVVFDGGTNDGLRLEPDYAFPDHEVAARSLWAEELGGAATRSAVYRLLLRVMAPVVSKTSSADVRVPAVKRMENIAAVQALGEQHGFKVLLLSQVYVESEHEAAPLEPRPAVCLTRYNAYAPVADVCALFEAMGDEAGTYFTDVIHTSPAGHDLIAKLVYDTLHGEGWLD